MTGRRARDREYAEFVRSSRSRLLGTAYLLCGDRDTAEDLVQTTLAKLYVAWPRVRRGGAEDAYARRILVNASIDAHRRPARVERPVAELPERVPPAPYDRMESDDLVAALAALPSRQRRVVVLRYWLDLSIEEVAADLQVTTGTVKSQTAKALHKLRIQLTADPTDELAEEHS